MHHGTCMYVLLIASTCIYLFELSTYIYIYSENIESLVLENRSYVYIYIEIYIYIFFTTCIRFLHTCTFQWIGLSLSMFWLCNLRCGLLLTNDNFIYTFYICRNIVVNLLIYIYMWLVHIGTEMIFFWYWLWWYIMRHSNSVCWNNPSMCRAVRNMKNTTSPHI